MNLAYGNWQVDAPDRKGCVLAFGGVRAPGNGDVLV